MTTYKYTGSSVTTLPLKTGDVVLHPGKPVSLPEDADVVRTLAAKKLLVAMDAQEAPVTPRYTGPDTNGCGEPGEVTAPAAAPEKPARKSKESA